ncbi:unnamed protein product [Cuscuta campestris]|uniref:DUF4219 domain-containing protein n=1 Tax=Cuscuta campestris TaxID=132261 RepID=A0A484N688_9ASTE|nr:unnamed protein product [Cuscuta campestris]
MGMIWIHWDPKRVALKVLYSYAQMVHCHIQWHEQKLEFFTSFVYGFNELEERKSLWKDIETYASSNEAWCVIGDFNVVLTSEDRKGGNPVSNGETADFRDCLEKCGLEEMPFSGPYFTWNNKQKGGDRIYSKLDRMVANIEWVLKMGTKTVIIHEVVSKADHASISCVMECLAHLYETTGLQLNPNKSQIRSRLRRYLEVQAECGNCGEKEETFEHLFWECTIAKEIREEIFMRMGIKCKATSLEHMETELGNIKTKRRKLMTNAGWAAVCYTIWKKRNDVIHNKNKDKEGIGEGQSTSRPPLFDGTNYTYWKERMRIYIRSTNFQLWLVIKNGEETPMKKVGEQLVPKTEDEFDAEDIKKVENYAKAINLLYCAVNPDDYRKISCCTTAKEMWDKLEVTYEGTDQVREAKIDFLTQEYEMFRMKEGEKIDDMFDRFSKIINDLHALKKTYANKDLARKILRSLTPEWRSKADAIYESIRVSDVTIDGLRGNLKTYESTILTPSLDEQKKKGIVLKATKETMEEVPSDYENEFGLVIKKFHKFKKK